MISRTVELCVLKEWWAHEWMEGCSEGVTPSLPISLSRSAQESASFSPPISRALTTPQAAAVENAAGAGTCADHGRHVPRRRSCGGAQEQPRRLCRVPHGP